eukprot:1679086-Prorocentrum_lima.AAC.1
MHDHCSDVSWPGANVFEALCFLQAPSHNALGAQVPAFRGTVVEREDLRPLGYFPMLQRPVDNEPALALALCVADVHAIHHLLQLGLLQH